MSDPPTTTGTVEDAPTGSRPTNGRPTILDKPSGIDTIKSRTNNP